MIPLSHKSADRRGSVLGAALILAVAVSLLLAGLIQWSQTERRTTQRHVMQGKARTTAESVAQYGAAQIKARLELITYFPNDEFRPSHNQPVLPDETLLQGLLGKKPKKEKIPKTNSNSAESVLPDDSIQNPAPPGSGYFRYEITPENLVVGRFQPARWERVETSNPLYVGDPLIDQTIRVREVRMVAAAKVADTLRRTTVMGYCEQFLQVRDSPVWGNMLFYNMDLEIAPWPPMEIHGPVHTNGNLYVQSGASLQFHGVVTAAGRLFHGRAPGGGSTSDGVVTFKKGGTTSEFVSLAQNNTWIDSRAADWVTQASKLWAGNVRTREHGINPALPTGIAPYVPDDPLTTANERRNSAHVVIEPARPTTDAGFPGNEIEVQKFAAKACLVIEVDADGVVSLYKYSAGSSGPYIRDTGLGAQQSVRLQLSVPEGLIVGGAASDKFYDARRARWINAVDIDIGNLKSLIEDSGKAAAFTRSSVTFNPATEWNGIVYVAHAHTARGGVRLVNGGTIPNRPTSANGNTAGFTLATDAPIYILGHYNADGEIASDGDRIRQPDSTAEPPAGIAADSVTILSQGWSDANSSRLLSHRQAQRTEVSAALLTGLVPTNQGGNGIYSGGVENLPRFLEDWSGVTFGYRGSMVVMYESERAIEPWGSSNVYNAPNRVWGFNALFASGVLPPGAPSARTYRRIGFRDLNSAQYQTALQAIDNE